MRCRQHPPRGRKIQRSGVHGMVGEHALKRLRERHALTEVDAFGRDVCPAQ